MSETITTTQLLDFFAKAHKVSSYVNVTKEDEGYKITVLADWYNDDHFTEQSIFITDECKCKYKPISYEYEDFHALDSDLNHLVKEEEEREMKRKKREELLSRLTDEEKELLYMDC